MQQGPTGTEGADYTQRLRRLSGARWKQLLDVQAPYRWNLRRLGLGRTLDVGSGLGRNLVNLGAGAVGVDHNPTSVAYTRSRGLEAYTTEEFLRSEHARPDAFDSMLAAHLLEHMPAEQAREVVASYLPFVRSGGRAVFITPQERGYDSDASHVRFVGFAEAADTCRELGLTMLRQYSFPFPRIAGRAFTYNEFVTVARLP
ncbi:class I SAM-dependent methyltransferase [Micromonospora craniellae]|uniref:Class I SAM-dependent methyltransferase n=1 Tax=Micromonospora craniellae TaxID=2294034 RepID=A0A372G148_9ACTN|nr:class I SAM-dependent methyltransferase [Micromonospora craniellae]QOC91951.1 class I SAM-dependent methyltransferase [Micromonospora craniellae]RFS46781.1 class I SAM-dependent methyltransferase [Micromonospora craniellae]